MVNFEGAEKQNIIIAESARAPSLGAELWAVHFGRRPRLSLDKAEVGFAVVALLVQTFATTLVKDILGLDEKEPKEPKAAEPKAEAGGE